MQPQTQYNVLIKFDGFCQPVISAKTGDEEWDIGKNGISIVYRNIRTFYGKFHC